MDYRELDQLIRHLDASVHDSAPQRGYWKELWSLIRQIGREFKETRYPELEDKNRAWSRFQGLVEAAKAKSEESRSGFHNKERDRDDRKTRSKRLAEELCSRANLARPLSANERAIGDIVFFPVKMLASAFTRLTESEPTSYLEEVRAELAECGENLKKAWEAFTIEKDSLLPDDRRQVYETLSGIQQVLDGAWNTWKSQKTRAYEERQVRWEQRQQEKANRKREAEERRQQFVESVHGNIANLEERRSEAQVKLERQQEVLEDLRNKYDTAWTDSFREKVSGWIDERELHISRLTEKIKRLSSWIDDARRKL